MAEDSSRRPLHERSHSQSNSRIRLVPSTPPRLLGQRDEIYSRTPLPTHPSHILLGPGRSRDGESPKPFQKVQTPADSTGSSIRNTLQPLHSVQSVTGSPTPTTKFKPPTKKRLHIHADNKTFSLLQEDSLPVDDNGKSPAILSPASWFSYDSLPSDASNTEPRDSSTSAATHEDTESHTSTVPGTPSTEARHRTTPDALESSPWNYQLVGGLRKVPKTPDLKQKAVVSSEGSLPPLPEALDGSPTSSHNLTTKPSFQSEHTTSTLSGNSNYKVYNHSSPSTSEAAFVVPHPGDSDLQIIKESETLGVQRSRSSIADLELYGPISDSASIIHRPQTSSSEANCYAFGADLSPTSSLGQRPYTSQSEAENYEVHSRDSHSTSLVNLSNPSKYSQESLVVPPLQPRTRRSNERLGYYKSRSRESLRAGSLTSISTVLSQKEALKAIVGSGSLIHLPVPSQKTKGSGSWAEPLGNHPPRSYMNEQSHQWSSQLSTVHSVSDIGSERNSRSWSNGTGRVSSGFPSTPSRNSRNVLSISSSVAHDDARVAGDLIEAPLPAFSRVAQRHLSGSSNHMVEEQDEYGDGLTSLHELRSRSSRTRLSGFNNLASENMRTGTMRSTASSRTNSLLGASIPTWARLYYGSGERRYLGAPGSSTDGSDSRTNSFRSGSPNTDHLPLGIYSPRRRPRARDERQHIQDSLEILSAPRDDGHVIEDRNPRGFRTWSMSSIWSPHLRADRRVTRYSMWEPPSVTWSADGSWFGRRNVQILMFITGFIFPFAWMIAAMLPLPANPLAEMQEIDNSTSNLGISGRGINNYGRRFMQADEAIYESALWWRRLNRWMTLVGLLIIIAIATLVIVGLRENW